MICGLPGHCELMAKIGIFRKNVAILTALLKRNRAKKKSRLREV